MSERQSNCERFSPSSALNEKRKRNTTETTRKRETIYVMIMHANKFRFKKQIDIDSWNKLKSFKISKKKKKTVDTLHQLLTTEFSDQ